MAIDFVNILEELETMGLFEIVLPFLLVFTITFAIINKTNIFGGKKNIDAIVALVLAFLAIRSEYFVDLMKTFLPNVAMFMIVILMFLMMFGIFAGEKKEWSRLPLLLGGAISFIFILFALFFDYADEYATFPDWLSDLYYSMDDRTKGVILFVGVLVIVILIATREKGTAGKERFWESFAKGLRGE